MILPRQHSAAHTERQSGGASGGQGGPQEQNDLLQTGTMMAPGAANV